MFYGDQPATAADARAVLELDEALRHARPERGSRRASRLGGAVRSTPRPADVATRPTARWPSGWLRRNRAITLIGPLILLAVLVLSVLTARCDAPR